MAEVIDLRKFRRFSGDGVTAQVGHELVHVIDISVAGLRLARPASWVSCRHVELRLIPLVKTGLDYHRAIPVQGHIVGDGPDHLRIAFASVTSALANVIGRHEGHGTATGAMAAELWVRPPAGQAKVQG